MIAPHPLAVLAQEHEAEIDRLREREAVLVEALTKIVEETRGWGGTLGGVHNCAAKALATVSDTPEKD